MRRSIPRQDTGQLAAAMTRVAKLATLAKPRASQRPPPMSRESQNGTSSVLLGVVQRSVQNLDRLAGTSLDNGVELDALADLPAQQQDALIERAAKGEKVSTPRARHSSRCIGAMAGAV